MFKRNSYTTLRSKMVALGFAMALCLSASSLAAQHNSAPGTSPAGTAITNQATLNYTLAGVAQSALNSNIVNVYVNQVDVYYVVTNDVGISTVPAGEDEVTTAGTAVTFTYSVVNLSNGPVTLTVATADAKGYLTTALTPVLTGAAYKSGVYTYAASGTGVSLVGTTLTIGQNDTASVVVTVTPPGSLTVGAWDQFVTTFADTTTAASGNYTVMPYTATGNASLWTTYKGLDIQVTSEVDIAANANFGKLQLLDIGCTGTTFYTTSVSGGVRTTTSASFPTLATLSLPSSWIRSGASAGQPTGVTGLSNVDANIGDCIAYQIVVNNPLTSGTISAGSISDLLNSNLTFQTSAPVAPSVNPAGAGTVNGSTPGLTAMSAINPGSTVVLQYEAKVK